MFINYYDIIGVYGNELTAGISIMIISFCIIFISLGFDIALSNINETDKILSALVLVFVFWNCCCFQCYCNTIAK